jgi:hypothetical protein
VRERCIACLATHSVRGRGLRELSICTKFQSSERRGERGPFAVREWPPHMHSGDPAHPSNMAWAALAVKHAPSCSIIPTYMPESVGWHFQEVRAGQNCQTLQTQAPSIGQNIDIFSIYNIKLAVNA